MEEGAARAASFEANAAAVNPGKVAGFWVRILADTLDGLILFAAGWLLALPFRSLFLRLGERGVFIGLAISMAYTGVLQSRFGSGRTLGKRLLGLRVVRPDGTLMSLDRSLVRYAMMGLLVYQGAVAQAVAAVLPFAGLKVLETIAGAIAIVLALGCVFVVPFHPLKRGLHDILAGTIVIRGAMPDPGYIAARTNGRRDRRILIGAAVLAALAVAATVAGSNRMSSFGIVKELTQLKTPLAAMGVRNVNVLIARPGRIGSTVIAYGVIPPRADGGEPAWDELHATFVKAVKAAPPPASNADGIGTDLRTGFSIGIYKSYRRRFLLENARTGAIIEAHDSSE